MNKNNKLDGSWENNIFKLVIKGNKYTSFYCDRRYGKGTVLYDDVNFNLTSTHARNLFWWTPFVEMVNGNLVIANDEVAVSNIDGRYNILNGAWKRL